MCCQPPSDIGEGLAHRQIGLQLLLEASQEFVRRCLSNRSQLLRFLVRILKLGRSLWSLPCSSLLERGRGVGLIRRVCSKWVTVKVLGDHGKRLAGLLVGVGEFRKCGSLILTSVLPRIGSRLIDTFLGGVHQFTGQVGIPSTLSLRCIQQILCSSGVYEG